MKIVNLTINGQPVQAYQNETILAAVRRLGLDDIPSLCHDERLEPFGSCFVCVVELEGQGKLVPSCATRVGEGMVVHTRSPRVIEARRTALNLLFSNHYADCIGPCTDNCPAHVDAQSYVALISLGRYEDALALIKQNNPLPLSIGRVCVRDCEVACRRGIVDSPVAINYLKRFVADRDARKKWRPKIAASTGKTVAVIGGGPAGLSAAYYLRLKGHAVTIFEKWPKLGGMLRYGIPEYRLPKAVLDDEIAWILDLGIEVQTGKVLGPDLSLADLKKQGFDACFLAVGADKASSMRLDFENETEGVHRGIEFLRDVELLDRPRLSGTAVVVGGGNTAIDAARTALRSGAEKVKIVYRRSLAEMPAHIEEIQAAQHEGVEILFLTNPISLIRDGHRLKGIRCAKMKLEEVPGERPRPVPIPGAEIDVACDAVIGAIGQQVNASFAEGVPGINLERWGTAIVDKDTLETNVPGVFAGGDLVNGPLTAISAIAHGGKAAFSIDSYLRFGEARAGAFKYFSFKHRFSEVTKQELVGYDPRPREKMPELAVSERVGNYREVELGLSENQALSETQRCIECGCQKYSDCDLRKYGDEYGADVTGLTGDMRREKVDERHPFILLDANKCINCGRCVRTCSEVLDVSALGFVQRGFATVVRPTMGRSLLETPCVSCGNCIDTCPTGALAERYTHKLLGTLPKSNHPVVCGFCSVGCKLNFKRIADTIYHVSNSTDEIIHSRNQGYACYRGRFGHRYLLSGERIREPLLRKDGRLQPVGWEEALAFIEERLTEVSKKFGSDSVALTGSPLWSNERLYSLAKWGREVLNTQALGSFSLLDCSALKAFDASVGMTSSTASLEDLRKADLIVVVDVDLNREALVLDLTLHQAQKGGARICNLGPEGTRLSRRADWHVPMAESHAEQVLGGALYRILNDRDSNPEPAYPKEALQRLGERVRTFDLESVAQSTGLDKDRLKELYALLADPRKRVVGIIRADRPHQSGGAEEQLMNLMLLGKRLGKSGQGLLVWSSLANTRGFLDMGMGADGLSGSGQTPGSFALKQHLRSGKARAVLCFGEDPCEHPEWGPLFLSSEFKLVADLFLTESARQADVVLPVRSLVEESGSTTSFDNRLQHSEAFAACSAIPPLWEMVADLAGWPRPSLQDLREEILRGNPLYAGVGDGQLCRHKETVTEAVETGKTSLLLGDPQARPAIDDKWPLDAYRYLREKVTAKIRS